MEEVLTEIESDDAVQQLAEWYKVKLCDKLADVFDGARRHAHGWTSKFHKRNSKAKRNTLSVNSTIN